MVNGMEVKLRGLTKRFGKTTAVNGIDVTFQDGKLTGLLGPSGCGKSTTLYMIAGLESVTEGDIFFGSRDVTTLMPEKRNIGLVFQNYALYPHMSVEENIAFPLTNRKHPETGRRCTRAECRQAVEEIARLVQIEDLLKRKPGQLSGGQQQRVAIARALASEAPVILADEPTGNLDEDTAQDITEILKESAHKMNKCVVVVTHSNELAKQADVVFRLKKGELQVLERTQDGNAQPQCRRNNAPRNERRAR